MEDKEQEYEVTVVVSFTFTVAAESVEDAERIGEDEWQDNIYSGWMESVEAELIEKEEEE